MFQRGTRTRRVARARRRWRGLAPVLLALALLLTLAGVGALPAGAGGASQTPTSQAFAWGSNNYAQLGDNSLSDRSTPVQVHGAANSGFLGDVTALAGGSHHSLALKRDGTVWAWGDNTNGQLGAVTTNTWSNTPVQVALPSGTTITAIAAGGYHSLALTNTGSVYAWGDNDNGQLGNGTAGSTVNSTPALVNLPTGVTITAIAAGFYYSLARTSNNTVYAWGNNGSGELGDGTSGNNRPTPVQVCAVYSSGTSTCTTPLTGVAAIAAGNSHSLALMNDSTVYAWGDNSSGELGNGTTLGSFTPVLVSGGLSGVTAIAAGSSHSLALKNDGTVVAWGTNLHGELGNGTTCNKPASGDNCQSTVPVPVSFLSGTTITAIAAGFGHNLALRDDHTVWAWGYNAYGQLGNNTSGSGSDSANSNIPVQVHGPGNVGFLTGVTAIGGGSMNHHSLAIAGPWVQLSTPSLDFGNHAVGTTSSGQSVTLTNTGSLTLTISGITVSGDFAQTNNCPTSLAVNASCTISVTFSPTTTGSRTGTLTIDDDAPGNPHTVALSGTGTPQPTVASINPTSGSTVGGTSVTITGTDFQPGATVSLGSSACTGVTVSSATSLTCTTGSHAAGTVDVVVTNPDGQSGTLRGGYTYVAPAAPPPPAPPAPPAPAPVPAPGLTYSGWQSQAGKLIGLAPTLVSFQNQLYVVAVGSDNQLYERHSADGVSFSDWRPLGGFADSALAATVHNGQLYLFGRGNGEQLYEMHSADGMTFTPWRALGGVLTSAPAATSFNGQLLVYAGGTDDALYLTSSGDGVTFSNWQSLGGRLPSQAADPTALVIQGGTLYVYARGTDDALYVMSSSDGATYGAWRSLGGVLTSGPAAASVGNTLVVVVRGTGNRLYEARTSDGGATYSPWRDLGGVLVTAPAATSFQNQIYIATEGTDQRLYLQASQP